MSVEVALNVANENRQTAEALLKQVNLLRTTLGINRGRVAMQDARWHFWTQPDANTKQREATRKEFEAFCKQNAPALGNRSPAALIRMSDSALQALQLEPEPRAQLSALVIRYWRLGGQSLEDEMTIKARGDRSLSLLDRTAQTGAFQEALEWESLIRLRDSARAGATDVIPQRIRIEQNENRLFAQMQQAMIDDFLTSAESYALYLRTNAATLPAAARNPALEKQLRDLLGQIGSSAPLAGLSYQAVFAERALGSYQAGLKVLQERRAKGEAVDEALVKTMQDNIELTQKYVKQFRSQLPANGEIDCQEEIGDNEIFSFAQRMRVTYPALPELNREALEKQRKANPQEYRKAVMAFLEQYCQILRKQNPGQQITPSMNEAVGLRWRITRRVSMSPTMSLQNLELMYAEYSRRVFSAATMTTQYQPRRLNFLGQGAEAVRRVFGAGFPGGADGMVPVRLPHAMYSTMLLQHGEHVTAHIWPDRTREPRQEDIEAVLRALGITDDIAQHWQNYTQNTSVLHARYLAFVASRGQFGPGVAAQGIMSEAEIQHYLARPIPHSIRQALEGGEFNITRGQLNQYLYIIRTDFAPRLQAVALMNDALEQIRGILQPANESMAMAARLSHALPGAYLDLLHRAGLVGNWRNINIPINVPNIVPVVGGVNIGAFAPGADLRRMENYEQFSKLIAARQAQFNVAIANIEGRQKGVVSALDRVAGLSERLHKLMVARPPESLNDANEADRKIKAEYIEIIRDLEAAQRELAEIMVKVDQELSTIVDTRALRSHAYQEAGSSSFFLGLSTGLAAWWTTGFLGLPKLLGRVPLVGRVLAPLGRVAQAGLAPWGEVPGLTKKGARLVGRFWMGAGDETMRWTVPFTGGRVPPMTLGAATGELNAIRSGAASGNLQARFGDAMRELADLEARAQGIPSSQRANFLQQLANRRAALITEMFTTLEGIPPNFLTSTLSNQQWQNTQRALRSMLASQELSTEARAAIQALAEGPKPASMQAFLEGMHGIGCRCPANLRAGFVAVMEAGGVPPAARTALLDTGAIGNWLGRMTQPIRAGISQLPLFNSLSNAGRTVANSSTGRALASTGRFGIRYGGPLLYLAGGIVEGVLAYQNDQEVGRNRKILADELTRAGYTSTNGITFTKDGITLNLRNEVPNTNTIAHGVNSGVLVSAAAVSAAIAYGAFASAAASGGPVTLIIAGVVVVIMVAVNSAAQYMNYRTIRDAHPMTLGMLGTAIVGRSEEEVMEHDFSDMWITEAPREAKEKVLFCLYVRELRISGAFQEVFEGTQMLRLSQNLLANPRSIGSRPAPGSISDDVTYTDLFNTFRTRILPLYNTSLLHHTPYERGFLNNYGRLYSAGANVTRDIVAVPVATQVTRKLMGQEDANQGGRGVFHEVFGRGVEERQRYREAMQIAMRGSVIWHHEDVTEQSYLNLIRLSELPNLNPNQVRIVQDMIALMSAYTVRGHRLGDDLKMLQENPRDPATGAIRSRASLFLSRVSDAWDGLPNNATIQSLNKAGSNPFSISIEGIHGLGTQSINAGEQNTRGFEREPMARTAQLEGFAQQLLPRVHGYEFYNFGRLPPVRSPFIEPPPFVLGTLNALTEQQGVLNKTSAEILTQFEALRKMEEGIPSLQATETMTAIQVQEQTRWLIGYQLRQLRVRLYLYNDSLVQYLDVLQRFQKQTEAMVKETVDIRNSIPGTADIRRFWDPATYQEFRLQGELAQGRPPMILVRGFNAPGSIRARDAQIVEMFLRSAENQELCNFSRGEIHSIIIQKSMTPQGTRYSATFVLMAGNGRRQCRYYSQGAMWNNADSQPTLSLPIPLVPTSEVGIGGVIRNPENEGLIRLGPRNLAIQNFARRMNARGLPVRFTLDGLENGAYAMGIGPAMQLDAAVEMHVEQYLQEVCAGLGGMTRSDRVNLPGGPRTGLLSFDLNGGDYAQVLWQLEERLIPSLSNGMRLQPMGEHEYERAALLSFATILLGNGVDERALLRKIQRSEDFENDIAALTKIITERLTAAPATDLHLTGNGDLAIANTIIHRGWGQEFGRDPFGAMRLLASTYHIQGDINFSHLDKAEAEAKAKGRAATLNEQVEAALLSLGGSTDAPRRMRDSLRVLRQFFSVNEPADRPPRLWLPNFEEDEKRADEIHEKDLKDEQDAQDEEDAKETRQQEEAKKKSLGNP